MADGGMSVYDGISVEETGTAALRPRLANDVDFGLRPFQALRAGNEIARNRDNEGAARVFVSALSGRAIERDFFNFLKSEDGAASMLRGEEIADLLSDRAFLRALPRGSVGRVYLRFEDTGRAATSSTWVDQPRLRTEDDLSWYERRVGASRGVMHVLTGYGRDTVGRAGLSRFIAAQTKNFGETCLAATQALSSKGFVAKFRAAGVLSEAREHGALASRVIDQNMPDLLAEPLSYARERLSILRPIRYQEMISAPQ